MISGGGRGQVLTVDFQARTKVMYIVQTCCACRPESHLRCSGSYVITKYIVVSPRDNPDDGTRKMVH